MADNFTLRVPGKPEYVGAVRLAISSVANQHGFDIEAIEDIKVAVSEACTNIVKHCETESSDGESIVYEVNCELHEDKIVISVQDNAGGYEISEYKEPDFNFEQEGGLGIFIIKALMDEVNVDSAVGAGTNIEMVKYVAVV